MKSIDELIVELCPNGVEYKPLGDIATSFFRGSGIKRDEVTTDGVPCVRYGEIYTTYNIGFDTCISHTTSEVAERARCFEQGDILFAITGEKIEDIAKCTAYLGHEKCYAGGDVAVMKHNQNPKYLAYALSTAEAQKQKIKGKAKSKVVHSSVPSLKSLVVPLPPLAVQKEIVRILDGFTGLIDELEKELAARIKQYEQYMEKLLTFGDEVDRKSLGEIGTSFVRGNGIKRDEVTAEGLPCVRYGEIYTKYNIGFDTCISHTTSEVAKRAKSFEHGDILFAITGEKVEDIAKCTAYLGYEKCYVGGDVVVMKHNQNPKFMAYVLSTADAQKQKSKGKTKSKVVHSSVPALKSITVPIPPLAEQKRIVEILDKFDALCNDETAGLAAEIAARKKQYEYYRDKLLTFKKAS